MLSDICNKISENERTEACRLLKKANNESIIEYRINLINLILSKISSQITEETSKTPNLTAEQISYTTIIDSKIQKQNSGIRNVTNTEGKKGKRFIDIISSTASIAAFVAFIGSEIIDFYIDIYPTDYNKHVVSVIIAVIIFMIVFLITKKN